MTEPARIRTLIVDDEPLARDALRILLEGDPDIEIVGECGNGLSAVRALRDRGVDLVLLDVQMPELDGFEVLEEIGPEAMPVVIFATAYDEYALKAFESQALDYLLKPFDDDRFARALDRAKAHLAQKEAATLTRQMASLLAEYRRPDPPSPLEAPPTTQDDRIAVRESGRLILLRPGEIDWVEAADYCIRIHAGPRSFLVRDTMESMARRLGSRRFMRIHRSAIVNLLKVREIRRATAGEPSVILTDGTAVKLSRTHRRPLESRLEDA